MLISANEKTVRFSIIADVSGPARCLSQFAAIGVLPVKFSAEVTGEDEISVFVEFAATEDVERINRALAKLSALPVMKHQ